MNANKLVAAILIFMLATLIGIVGYIAYQESQPVHGVITEMHYVPSHTKKYRKKMGSVYRTKTRTIPAAYFIVVERDGGKGERRVDITEAEFAELNIGSRYDETK